VGREQTKDADGLTAQWRAVINHYLADPQRNKKAAYQQVYDPKRKQPDGPLRAAATRLFKNSAVKAYVDRRNADVAAALELTQERVVREWVRLGFFDVRKLFDADGNLLPIHQLPDDVAAAVASVEVVAVKGTGKEGEPVVHVKRVRLWDKRATLDAMARHLKMFGDEGEGEVHVHIHLGEKLREAKARADAARAQLGEAGDG